MILIHRTLLTGLSLLAACSCLQLDPSSGNPTGPPDRETYDPAVPHDAGAVNLQVERDIIRGIRQHTFSEIGADVDPEVSIDGKRLYFASTHLTNRHDIFYKDKDSSTITQVTSNPWDDRSPKVSPDGRWLAFVSNRRGNWDIYMVTTGPSGREVRLTNDDSDEIHPSWSPDGRMIAYSSRNRRSGQWEIKMLDLRTKTTAMLEGISGLFPAWSPDGEKIVFQRARGRSPEWYALWIVNVDGTELTQLVSSHEWAAINPAWTPDAKHVLFSTVAKSPEMRDYEMTADDIWIVNIDGTNLTKLTAGIEAEWDPTLGPDGRVYFCSTRSGFKNIWSAELQLLDITHMEPSGGKVLPAVQIRSRPSTKNMTDAPVHLTEDFDLIDELDNLETEAPQTQ